MGDSGPGLAAPALERVFEAFYSTKLGGLGLGLRASQQLEAQQRGHTRLEVSADMFEKDLNEPGCRNDRSISPAGGSAVVFVGARPRRRLAPHGGRARTADRGGGTVEIVPELLGEIWRAPTA